MHTYPHTYVYTCIILTRFFTCKSHKLICIFGLFDFDPSAFLFNRYLIEVGDGVVEFRGIVFSDAAGSSV